MGGKIASEVLPVGRCRTCNKDWHRTRRSAKKFMRATGLARDGHMNVYRCPADDRYLHIGHLPPAVLEGRLTRGEMYRPTENRRVLTQEDRMTPPTTYTSTSPGFEAPATPAVKPRKVAVPAPAPAAPFNPYPEGATAALNEMLADLRTYRYVVNVEVTPAMARALIDLNAENNRNHMTSVSDRYARDMEKGNWREQTGQTIKIAWDGTLIDGLHRTWAVLKSLKTSKFDLCFGIDPADIVVVDALKARSTAQIVKIAGGLDMGRSSGIVRRVIAWESGYPIGVKGSETATPIEIFERFRQDPELFDAAVRRGADCANHNVGTALVAGTFYFIVCRNELDAPVAREFYDRLVSGLGFDDTNTAIRELRERMIRRKNDRLSTNEMLALFSRAWNRYNTIVAGRRESVKRLLFTQEDLTPAGFPHPIAAHPLNREIAARFQAGQ